MCRKILWKSLSNLYFSDTLPFSKVLEKLARRETDRQINISSMNIKGSCVVSPETILLSLLNWPETFFYIMWFTFWKYKQMYLNESQSSFIFQNFYIHLFISGYERDFSLFNFFFGILKHFPKVFLILKYFFENHSFPFKKWLLSTTYTRYLFKNMQYYGFQSVGTLMISERMFILNVILVKWKEH